MLLLVSTSDKIQVITGQAVTVDVHASYMDYNGTTVTPGRKNTAISTAVTTDVVAAPGASTQRNIKCLTIRNKNTVNAVDVTVQHTDGTTTVELFKDNLSPGEVIQYTDGDGFATTPITATAAEEYYGKLAVPFGRGDPNVLMQEWQAGGHIDSTPTNITTSVARCSAFRLKNSLVVNKVRFYGVGAVATTYRIAIYRYSDLARLSAETAFTTVANAWGSVYSGLNLTLNAGELYFLACSVNATGTTAGLACLGATSTASIGQIQSTPTGLPGNLSLTAGFQSSYWFQFAVTTGALPDPAPTLALPAAWTGGFPIFFLDNNNA